MIKIFAADNSSAVEEKANEWLEKNKDQKVKLMTISSDAVFNPGRGENVIRTVRLALYLE